jgi:hypothetical protein
MWKSANPAIVSDTREIVASLTGEDITQRLELLVSALILAGDEWRPVRLRSESDGKLGTILTVILERVPPKTTEAPGETDSALNRPATDDPFPGPTGNGTEDIERIKAWYERHPNQRPYRPARGCFHKFTDDHGICRACGHAGENACDPFKHERTHTPSDAPSADLGHLMIAALKMDRDALGALLGIAKTYNEMAQALETAPGADTFRQWVGAIDESASVLRKAWESGGLPSSPNVLRYMAARCILLTCGLRQYTEAR